MALVALALAPGAAAHGTHVEDGAGYEVWWGLPSHVYIHLDGATFAALAQPGSGWALAWDLAAPIEEALVREHAARPAGAWYCDGDPGYVQPLPCRLRVAIELQAHVNAGDADVHFDRYFGYAGALPLG